MHKDTPPELGHLTLVELRAVIQSALLDIKEARTQDALNRLAQVLDALVYHDTH